MSARKSAVLAMSGALAVTGASVVTASAQAAPEQVRNPQAVEAVHLAGYEPKSVIHRNIPHEPSYCTAWVYTKKSGGHKYAKAVVRSSGKLAPHCQVYLSRRHGSGPYKPASNGAFIAVRETLSTKYYLDDPGYKARACLSNLDRGDQGFHCGAGV